MGSLSVYVWQIQQPGSIEPAAQLGMGEDEPLEGGGKEKEAEREKVGSTGNQDYVICID